MYLTFNCIDEYLCRLYQEKVGKIVSLRMGEKVAECKIISVNEDRVKIYTCNEEVTEELKLKLNQTMFNTKNVNYEY